MEVLLAGIVKSESLRDDILGSELLGNNQQQVYFFPFGTNLWDSKN